MKPSGEETADYPSPEAPARDGIGEEDNPIPLWFNVGFYGAIVFGVIYILYYTLSGWSSQGQWKAAVAAAREQQASTQVALPTTNPYKGDPEAVKEGSAVFHQICAACHKPDATGLVGPSLVDPYWKYGDSDADRFQTVAEGRPGGMPPWKAVLGTEKIWKVLAYLDTLPRTDQPGVGAPGYAPAGTAAAGPGAAGS